jgi:hypothetical protein
MSRSPLGPVAQCLTIALAIVTGTIGDRTTGQPLMGVGITIGSAHATTKADGRFRLTGVKPGPATLMVESDDVPPQHFSVKIGAKTTRVELRVCSTTLDYNCGPLQ